MLSPEKLNAMKRISDEFKQINRNGLGSFQISVGLFNEDNIFIWKCSLLGPSDSIYKGGLFYLKIIFPDNYPTTRPEVLFLNPIYHLNVKYFVGKFAPLGHINMSTLNLWNPGDSINLIFFIIKRFKSKH